MQSFKHVSVIIPAKNESSAIADVIRQIQKLISDCEIIVVNDGSTDDTAFIAEDAGASVISHPYSKGNGASIKTGARNAHGDIFVFMDGDGQHNPDSIPQMLDELDKGHDMVIGARYWKSHASKSRLLANTLYNRIATLMVGHKVEDLTSGFRVVKASIFKQFLSLLPNGFSYPTTITMAFFRAGYSVKYHPIVAKQRQGNSHISPLKDGIRFLLIIFKVGTLYSPLKIFLPLSLLIFFTGISYYFYTFVTYGRFTNMSALLFTTSIIIFLIGLVSEQITSLLYVNNSSKNE